MEEFDFRKPEDQERFDNLPKRTQKILKNKAHQEAIVENESRDKTEYARKVESGDEPLDLTSLLKIKKNQYESVIRASQITSSFEGWSDEALFTSYARLFLRFLYSPSEEEAERSAEVRHFLEQKLKGKIVVDLGGNNMQRLARDMGARVYIAVDLYEFGKEYPADSSLNLSPGKKDGEMEVVSVKSDMLEFLSRLPDKSVCICINGIDGALISYDAYHDALATEISRVISEGGIVFGNDSSCLMNMRTAAQVMKENGIEKKEDIEEYKTGDGGNYYEYLKKLFPLYQAIKNANLTLHEEFAKDFEYGLTDMVIIEKKKR